MDIKLLPARVKDLKQIVDRTASPKFTAFLTPEEVSVAVKQFSIGEKHDLFGGYDNAERVMLGVLPDWCEEATFPITAITFNYRPCDKLLHRDFLGALMALGITRESVGDILVGEGKTVAFVSSDVSRFVLTQVNKIGNVGVSLSEGFAEPLPQLGQKKEFSVTVASTRLDCVVAAICNLSRTQAADKIIDGFVSVNSVGVMKPTLNVKSQDKITVRQKGRFEIDSCDEISKKGRIILKYDKYI